MIKFNIKKTLIIFLLLCIWLPKIKSQVDQTFWFVAPEVSSNETYNWWFDRPIYFHFTTTSSSAIVTISFPANQSINSITLNVSANSSVSYNITSLIDNIENRPANQPLNKGILITSTAPINCYYEVVSTYNTATPELFTLKGESALGYDFYIPSQNFFDNASFFNYQPTPYSSFDIVATEDNTTITITPKAAIIGHPANSPFSISINKGQTFSCVATSQSPNQHLNGSKISADKKIAVTYSDDLVHAGDAADLIGDQIVPIDKIGNEYIIIKGDLLSNYEKVFITAIENNTPIYVAGSTTPTTTLNEGQTYALSISSNYTHIKSTKSFYVLQVTGYEDELGAAIIPTIRCTGSKAVSYRRTTNRTLQLLLLTKSGNENFFQFNNSSTIINGSSFSFVPGTNNEWKAAKVTINTSVLPINSTGVIKNTNGLFHVGILEGNSTNGASYGYFSDFKNFDITSITSNHSPHNAFCIGDTIKLFSDSISDATYTWTGPNNFGANSSMVIIPNATQNSSGQYSVLAGVIGCQSIPATININIEVPSVSLPPDMVVNPNQAVSISAQGSFATAVWSNGFVGNPLQINPTMSNRYYVTVTTANAGCTATDSIVVKVLDAPTILKNPDEINICEGLPINAGINFYYSLPQCSNHFEYRTRTNSTWTAWTNYISNSDIPTLGLSEIQLRAYQLSCNNSGYIINSDTAYANWIIHPQITRESFIRNPFEDGICLGANLSLTVDTLPGVPFNFEFQYQAPTQIGWANGNSTTPTNIGMAWIRGRAIAEGFGCISTGWEWFAWLVQAQPEIQGLTDQNICQGTNVEFLANVVDGYGNNTFQWQHSNAGCNSWQNISGENQASLITDIYNQPTSDYFRLLVQQSGYNCFDTSSCVTVNVFNSPVVTIDGNNLICEGETLTITATTIGGSGTNIYNWYLRLDPTLPPVFYTSTTDAFIEISGLTDSLYVSVNLIQSVPNCQAWSNEIFVRVKKQISITQQPLSVQACLNNPLSISVIATGDMPISYQWYGPNGLINGATTPQLDFLSITWADSGSYYCTVSNSCGTTSSSIAHITINNIYEPATSIFGISSRCSGAGWNMFSANSVNETSKRWEISPMEAGTMDSISGLVSWNPTFVGVANILYIASACGTTDTLTHPVSNLLAVGNPTEIYGDSIRCQGFGFSQYTTFAENAISYVWQILNAGMSTINPSTGYVLWDTNFRETATIVVYALGCNGASSTISKNVHFNWFVPIHSLGHVEICLGEPATFTAILDTVTPFGYQWFGPNGILMGETDSILFIPSTSLSDTGAYYCRVNTYCGYSFTPFDTLTIHVPPIVSFIALPNCMSENIAFTNTSISDDIPMSAHWNFGDGNESNDFHPNHSYIINGSYSIKLKVQSAFGCIDSTTSNIEIYEKPFFTIQTNQVLCYDSLNGSISIEMTGGTPEYSYVLNNGTPQDTNYFGNLPAGKYFITVYDDHLCSYSDSVTISQPQSLVSSYLFSNVLCYADSTGIISLSVAGGTPPYTFLWSNGAIDSTINVPAGNYDVIVNDANGCIITHDGIYISQPNPIVIDSIIVQRSCELLKDGLIAVYPTGGYGSYQFAWSNFSVNDSIMNLNSGIYTVTISDDNNCAYIQSFEIFPNCKQCWEIWSSFSPNGDGINDEWNIRFSQLYPNMLVQIFNRWGGIVYESIGEYKPWDGKGPGGKFVPPETYYFVIDLRDDVTKRITGTVTVIY